MDTLPDNLYLQSQKLAKPPDSRAESAVNRRQFGRNAKESRAGRESVRF